MFIFVVKKIMAKDLSGMRFSRLTVIRLTGETTNGKKRFPYYLCRCSCGNHKKVNSHNLVYGGVKSCGCMAVEQRNNLSHGESYTKEYKAWVQMKARCFNENVPNFKGYGGRGITVCDRWKNSYDNFISDMGKMPNQRLSIDRIDVNGNYEPSNCRWATRREQNLNRTNTLFLEYNGKSQTLTEWSEELGIHYDILRGRIFRQGWTIGEVISAKKDNGVVSKRDRSKLKLSVEEIIDLYKKGLKPEEIAQQANCASCWVSRILRDSGYRQRTRRKKEEELLTKKLPIKQIAAITG